jgi:hypothetical protein
MTNGGVRSSLLSAKSLSAGCRLNVYQFFNGIIQILMANLFKK